MTGARPRLLTVSAASLLVLFLSLAPPPAALAESPSPAEPDPKADVDDLVSLLKQGEASGGLSEYGEEKPVLFTNDKLRREVDFRRPGYHETLYDLLRFPNERVRSNAAITLARLGDYRAYGALRALLTQGEPMTVKQAIAAFGYLPAAGTVNLVLPFLFGDDPGLRLTAEETLVRLADPSVCPLLDQRRNAALAKKIRAAADAAGVDPSRPTPLPGSGSRRAAGDLLLAVLADGLPLIGPYSVPDRPIGYLFDRAAYARPARGGDWSAVVLLRQPPAASGTPRFTLEVLHGRSGAWVVEQRLSPQEARRDLQEPAPASEGALLETVDVDGDGARDIVVGLRGGGEEDVETERGPLEITIFLRRGGAYKPGFRAQDLAAGRFRSLPGGFEISTAESPPGSPRKVRVYRWTPASSEFTLVATRSER